MAANVCAEGGHAKLASFVKENPNPALEISADGSITYLNSLTAEKLAQAVGRAHPREILPPDVNEIVAGCLQLGAGRSTWRPKSATAPYPGRFILCFPATWCSVTEKTSPRV